MQHSRDAYEILRDLQRSGAGLPGTDGELQQHGAREILLGHAMLLLTDLPGDPQALDEAFRASQSAQQSRASEAIRLASIRLAEQHTGLADLLRRRSDDADALRQVEFLLRGQIAQGGASRSYPREGSQLLLGEDATIQNVLAEPLAAFRVLAFASHAVMAGELPGLTEPAIVLSSADGADPAGGLLTASRVASLDLRADLVILSACNTDAPDSGPFADGFSGLARAFLYAGARSLLVSQWRIGSAATVPLTTGFVANLSASPAMGKAEALR